MTDTDTFDMNLTIVLATIPGAMLLYGLVAPTSSVAFWELAGWAALVETVFLFGVRHLRKRKMKPDRVSSADHDSKNGE